MAVCGCEFTSTVTEDGSIYIWGNVHNRGCAADAELLPARVTTFNSRVVMVSAGSHYSVAVMEDGSLYTWGYGYNGELGHGSREYQRSPIKLEKEEWGGSPAVQVACGVIHTIVLTADSEVFTCGSGAYGQLGHGDYEDRVVPTQVLTCCSGSYGRLGHGDYEDRVVPTPVLMEYFEGIRIVMVAAGGHHSVALGEDGSMWTWGDGEGGCLGHNNEEERLVPTKLTDEAINEAKVVMVATGNCHTVAVAHDGVLWVWGSGMWDQLGLGDCDNRLFPTSVAVEAFGGSRVLMASCGEKHTLAVTEDGKMYSCGDGEYGKLGHNDENSRQIFTRISAKHFDYTKIVSASAGTYHSLAVTDDGVLYTWGRRLGLGHSDKQDKYVPTRVDMELLDNKRVGRYQGLRPEFALAFAMGALDSLGSECSYSSICSDVLEVIQKACTLHPEGQTLKLEGVIRLMGGGLKSDWRRSQD